MEAAAGPSRVNLMLLKIIEGQDVDPLRSKLSNTLHQIPERDSLNRYQQARRKEENSATHRGQADLSQNCITSLQTCKDKRSFSYPAPDQEDASLPLSQKRTFHHGVMCVPAAGRGNNQLLVLIPIQPGSCQLILMIF